MIIKLKTYTMNKYIIYSLFATPLLNLSCNKFLAVDPPKTEVAAASAFSDEKTATATVGGLYTSMNNYNNQFASGLMSIVLSSLADDYNSAFTSYDEYKYNRLSPATSYLDRLWSQPYSYINHSNKIIEGLEASALSAKVKAQLSAEARFTRVFNYFYLCNLFQKVPLITDTKYLESNNQKGPASREELYAFMLGDLKQAAVDISDTYQGNERTRPNRKAVDALLARVYLYHGDWADAEATADKVIGDKRYELSRDLNTVFLKTSKEAIWQLQTVNLSTAGVNTWEGFSIVPAVATARSYYQLYDTTVAAYEENDLRKSQWLKPYVVNNKTLYMPYKYKLRTATPVAEYNTVLRLAEQYLIRAEARLNQNKLQAALQDINQIRERAGLAALPQTLDKAAIALALEKERQLELLGEWGHRWFDLVRTNRALPVLSKVKTDFSQSDTKIPIASAILLTNGNLQQND